MSVIRFKYKIYKTKQKGGEMYYYNLDDDERKFFDEDIGYFSDFKLPQAGTGINQLGLLLEDCKEGDCLPSLPMNFKIGTKLKGLVVGNRRLNYWLDYEGWAYDRLPLTEEDKEQLKQNKEIFLVFRKVGSNKHLYVFRDFVGVDNRTKVITP